MEQRMCLGTFLRLRRSLATPTLYAAVRILSGAFFFILGKDFPNIKKTPIQDISVLYESQKSAILSN